MEELFPFIPFFAADFLPNVMDNSEEGKLTSIVI